MEEAIYSDTGYNKKGKHFSEYMDIESFAAVYTVQELLKNWDAYTSSMFFFKDADKDGVTSKIYMGPLWDLDNTLGNINFNKEFGTDTSYLWAQNGEFYSYGKLVVRTFAKKLMEHRDFQVVNAEIYEKAYSEVQKYLAPGGWFETESEKISASVTMDRTRWEMYDSDRWLLNYAGRKSSVKFVQFSEYGNHDDTTDKTALGFMRYYLSARAQALKSSIGTVTAEKPPQQNTTGTNATTGANSETTTGTSETTATVAGPQADAANPDIPLVTAIVSALFGTMIITTLAVFILRKRR
jgi:hypothetical protein